MNSACLTGQSNPNRFERFPFKPPAVLEVIGLQFTPTGYYTAFASGVICQRHCFVSTFGLAYGVTSFLLSISRIFSPFSFFEPTSKPDLSSQSSLFSSFCPLLDRQRSMARSFLARLFSIRSPHPAQICVRCTTAPIDWKCLTPEAQRVLLCHDFLKLVLI